MNVNVFLDKDVLAALKEGAKLCPFCLGKKRVLINIPADFLGDFSGKVYWECPDCKGTGLEIVPHG